MTPPSRKVSSGRLRPRRAGIAEARDPREDIPDGHHRVPGNRTHPIMTERMTACFSPRAAEGDHVADGVEDGVGANVIRRAACHSRPCQAPRHRNQRRPGPGSRAARSRTVRAGHRRTAQVDRALFTQNRSMPFAEMVREESIVLVAGFCSSNRSVPECGLFCSTRQWRCVRGQDEAQLCTILPTGTTRPFRTSPMYFVAAFPAQPRDVRRDRGCGRAGDQLRHGRLCRQRQRQAPRRTRAALMAMRRLLR